MANRTDDRKVLRCSFCNKTESQVRRLLAGQNVYICNECIEICYEIIEEEFSDEVETSGDVNLLKPVEIKEYLDQYVIGQDAAKKVLAVAVYNHYKRILSAKEMDVDLQKSNILMIGPTGSGKTFLAQNLAKLLNVPFAIADATALTEAGYVGEDVENILLKLIQAADYDIERAECGIIYIDEIDKITRKSENTSITRDVSGEGVQQALLKMVEGSQVGVMPQEGRKHPEQPLLYVDTTNILFIGAGAFSEIEDIIDRRVSPNTKIGFKSVRKSEEDDVYDKKNCFEYMSQEDLREYGLIPEFIGRFPILTSVKQLEVEDLVKIIKEPDDNILDQYSTMFSFDNIELVIEDAAITYIAKVAKSLKTGARALRSIFENVLEDYMFELPGSGITAFTITEEDVKDRLSKRYKNIEIDE